MAPNDRRAGIGGVGAVAARAPQRAPGIVALHAQPGSPPGSWLARKVSNMRVRIARRRRQPGTRRDRQLHQPRGPRRSRSGTARSASRMKCTQIGTAVRAPSSPSPSGRSWSKPTQTVATRFWLKPLNQVSRASLVVPVLPDRSLRPSASARRPVPRRITSAIMSSRIQAVRRRDDPRRQAGLLQYRADGLRRHRRHPGCRRQQGSGAGIGCRGAVARRSADRLVVTRAGLRPARPTAALPRTRCRRSTGCARQSTSPAAFSMRSMKYGCTLKPPLAKVAKPVATSSGVAGSVPSASVRLRGIALRWKPKRVGVVDRGIGARCCSSMRIDTRLRDRTSASRRRIGPMKSPPEFSGRQASSMPRVIEHDRRSP